MATYFAAAFAVEALLPIWTGVIRNALAFSPATSVTHRIGLGVYCLALFLQPLVGPLLGREWLQMEISDSHPIPPR